MSKPTCPKCKVEAVEVHMLLSSFMGCPTCKEDVTLMAPEPVATIYGRTVSIDGGYQALRFSPTMTDYENFLAKKLGAYVSWNVFTEEFDVLYAGGQGTSYTYDTVKNMYDIGDKS